MKLNQKQRDEIRYAFEDAGMPEVLSFMAAKVADVDKDSIFYDGIQNAVWGMCTWSNTEQGHDFWRAVAAEFDKD